MAKATLKERAYKFADKEAAFDRTSREYGTVCYLAGWHARGRAERITKAGPDRFRADLETIVRTWLGASEPKRDRAMIEQIMGAFERTRRKA